MAATWLLGVPSEVPQISCLGQSSISIKGGFTRNHVSFGSMAVEQWVDAGIHM